MRVYCNSPEEFEALFWSRVDKNGPVPTHVPDIGNCWIYEYNPLEDGYGRFWDGQRRQIAHRYSFFLAHGRYPADCALHRCDNPKCVRPSHLFEGTRADNNKDRNKKGRGIHPKGSGHHAARLTEKDVIEIRSLYLSVSTNELAERFGINRSQVGRIGRRERWSHIPDLPAVDVSPASTSGGWESIPPA